MKRLLSLSKVLLFLCSLSSVNLFADHAPIDKKSCRHPFVHLTRNNWHIDGNDNIDPSENFLGTPNQIPINISANGFPTTLPYIRVTALGQIEVFNTLQGLFIGEGAGAVNKGTHNTFVGYNSGHNTTVEPVFQEPGENTAVGYSSLFSNTIGEDNTALGSSALFSAVQASKNTAVGFQALFASVDGAFNTAVGSEALNAGATGSFNTAVGFSALHNTAQNFNTAVGFQCMGGNATGTLNTAIGSDALLNNTTGSQNTAIGVNTLISNQTGTRNTALGANADVNPFSGVLTNATAIGFAAVCNASNKVRIGNADVEVIEGEVDFTTPSDGRFKINVQENVPGLAFIMNLRPVTYQIDSELKAAVMHLPKENKKADKGVVKSGFIAQEVELAAKECGYSFDGVNVPKNDKEGYYGLAYSSFVMSLVKAVQEQQAQIEDLKHQIHQLTTEAQRDTEKL